MYMYIYMYIYIYIIYVHISSFWHAINSSLYAYWMFHWMDQANARKSALAQKNKIRAVVIDKKQELEALPTAQLSKLVDAAGFKGLRSQRTFE